MATGENILQDIRMLVTDVDGTLMGRHPEFDRFRRFHQRIDDLRRREVTSWIICTGRSLSTFTRIFFPMRSFQLAPDYVITSHAFIFRRRGRWFIPFVKWNLKVQFSQYLHWWHIRTLAPRLHHIITRRIPFAYTSYHDRDQISFHFSDAGAADFAAELIREQIPKDKGLELHRRERDIAIYTVPYTKGSAMMELASHLRVSPRHILVIGDGHHDISMMAATVAAHVGCPANAAPDVITTVHKAGGHIASQKHLAGVMEILDAFEGQGIHSELPEDWTPPPPGKPVTRTQRQRHSHQREKYFELVLFFAAVYVTLLAIASTGVLPFPNLILWPYLMLLKGVTHLLAPWLPTP